jgi:hypothetical protein
VVRKKKPTDGLRQVPNGSGQAPKEQGARDAGKKELGNYKIPKKAPGSGQGGDGKGGNRGKEGAGGSGSSGAGSYAAAAAAASTTRILWVYEGRTTKVPLFFEAFAPFQEALGMALENAIWEGNFGTARIGLDEVLYHKKMRSIKLVCANEGSVKPVKELVAGLTIEDKIYRAWGSNEEPATFDMVAYLGPWQKTPLERVKTMLCYSNPGLPENGWEVLAVWEQERSRKIDVRADQGFYDAVRGLNWRLKYPMGYADCCVGKHGAVAGRQEQVRDSEC